jgi:hypothetical protein
MRWTRLLAASLALVVAAACPRTDATAVDAGTRQTKTTTTTTTDAGVVADPLAKRPPHPTMASALWGEQVALQLGRTIDAAPPTPGAAATDARALLAQAVTALHTLEPGAEPRARELAVRAWKAAPDDVTRGTALAVAAMAMVLDPTVDGYAERLTDAFGLAAYAGTVDATDATGQCARAIVGAAAGASRQARALIDLVASTPTLGDDTRAMLALARDAVRDRSDAFFDDVAGGLRARPDGARLKAAQADRLLELCLLDDALKVVDGAKAPALAVIAGRARVLAGDDASGIALLQPLAERLTGVDEPRRAEALFWLGLAQARGATTADAARATQAALTLRAGWAKEGALLGAVVDVTAGNLDAAKKALLPLAQGTPSSTVIVERIVVTTLLDVCGATGDLACVDRAARRHRLLDVDPTPPLRARAAALAKASATSTTTPMTPMTNGSPDAGVADAGTATTTTTSPSPGGTPTAEELKQEADRLSPGTSAQQRGLLAVRRALASKCPERARSTIEALAKDPDLRAARALAASFRATPLLSAQQAAAAITGKGAPLAEDDLVDVVDALGGARLKDTEALLTLLGKDPRTRIQRAVERARLDLKDPESRRKRLAGEHAEEGALPSTSPTTGGPEGVPPNLPGLPPGVPTEAAP